jgi:polyisoprenoid-binding protein YceI
MKRTIGSLLLGAALAALPASAADTYTVDKSHSEVGFQVRHLVSKVRGRFTDFEGAVQIEPGKPEASSVELTIKTASIDTTQASRDEELRSAAFFDAEKFPTITFRSTKVVATGKDKYAVTGKLTMHGVEKEVTLDMTLLGTTKDARGNEVMGFEGQTTVDRKQFGIDWNKALDNGGYLVGDDVNVVVNVEARKKKPEAAKAGTN